MSTSGPVPTVGRGDLTLQPAYFTSSLFVDPLREDISHLVRLFAEKYLTGDQKQPFALFKKIWIEQGWSWFHLKVFDARAREKFVTVTLRLFAEYFIENTNPLAMVVALFGLYTFFLSQPSSSAPSLYSVKHIALPINMYKNLIALPSSLTEAHLLPLRPYATHVLSVLLDAQAFHILPESSLRPYNPSDLPREFFVEDDVDPATVFDPSSSEATTSTAPKKKGRPGKREKAKRAKEALTALDKWLDKNTYTYTDNAAGPSTTKTTHTLLSHPPTASRAIYTMQKTELLDVLDPSSKPALGLGPVNANIGQTDAELAIDPSLVATTSPGREAMARSNDAVLSRLRRIDEMAAEQGLEVGGEGGEMTGLTRVERAVGEFHAGRSRGGILNMLEGAGVSVPAFLTSVGTQRAGPDDSGSGERARRERSPRAAQPAVASSSTSNA
ncbi:hypothetical protein EIP86_007570 [Pleurotus ostreatoroseus]|nr:hypothetical protein EIP86_007570 [Pleurotus ostreatoroseus]